MCQISPEDVAVATSSCLYSLSAVRDELEHQKCWLVDAIGEMIAGGAPNLKHVFLYNTLSYAAIEHRRAMPRLDWTPGTVKLPVGSGILESLVLYGAWCKKDLQDLAPYFKSCALRTLKIYDWLESEDLQWLRHNFELTSLEELGLSPLNPVSSGAEDESFIVGFLQALRPLTHLELKFPCYLENLDPILRDRGMRLRTLDCAGTTVSLDMLALIREYCPEIQEFRATLPRSNNGEQEEAIYAALGRLPTLDRLQLTLLSAKAQTGLGRDSDTEDLIGVLKSFALDEDLAAAIFRRIVAARLKLPSPHATFERLRLNPRFYQLPDPAFPELREVCEFIGRSWTCTRVSAADPMLCSVQPYLQNDGNPGAVTETPWLKAVLGGPVGPALLSLWPECKDGNLVGAWHSFPLPDVPSDADAP